MSDNINPVACPVQAESEMLQHHRRLLASAEAKRDECQRDAEMFLAQARRFREAGEEEDATESEEYAKDSSDEARDAAREIEAERDFIAELEREHPRDYDPLGELLYLDDETLLRQAREIQTPLEAEVVAGRAGSERADSLRQSFRIYLRVMSSRGLTLYGRPAAPPSVRKGNIVEPSVDDGTEVSVAIEQPVALSETEASRLFAGLRKYMQNALKARDPAAYAFNEDGTARLLVDLLLGRALQVADLGGMFFYDETSGTWRRADLIPESVRFIAEIVNGIFTADPDEAKRKGKHVAKLLTAQGVRAIEYMVLADPRIMANASIFDERRDLIVFSNGVYELTGSAFREHRPEDMSTMTTGVAFNPDAKAPTFQRVVTEALESRADDVKFLQKWAGYALSGFTDEQAALFVPGPTNTSKSTIFGALHHAFGSYSRVLPVTTLMQQRERTATNDLAGLRAIRNVETSEVTRGARLDEALFKTLVGQDPVTARLLYREFFTFMPHFKVTMHTNFLPVVNGADAAVFRRVRTLPFHHVVPPDDRDPQLREKLQAEAEGILQWALEGFRLWRRERLGATSTTDSAAAEYKRSSDTLADFLDEACIVEHGRESVSSTLYQHYEEWSKGAGIDRPMTQKSFVLALKERGFTVEKKSYANIVLGIEPRAIENGERIPF